MRERRSQKSLPVLTKHLVMHRGACMARAPPLHARKNLGAWACAQPLLRGGGPKLRRATHPPPDVPLLVAASRRAARASGCVVAPSRVRGEAAPQVRMEPETFGARIWEGRPRRIALGLHGEAEARPKVGAQSVEGGAQGARRVGYVSKGAMSVHQERARNKWARSETGGGVGQNLAGISLATPTWRRIAATGTASGPHVEASSRPDWARGGSSSFFALRRCCRTVIIFLLKPVTVATSVVLPAIYNQFRRRSSSGP